MAKLVTMLFAIMFTCVSHASVSTPSYHKKGWDQHKLFLAQTVKEADGDLLETTVLLSMESGFDFSAVNPKTGATGGPQFTKRTWNAVIKEFGPKYGLSKNTPRTNKRASVLMQIEHNKDNRRVLERRLGRPVQTHEVFLAHFLGQGGSYKMLRAKNNRLAKDVLPDAAAMNPNHFYRDGKRRQQPYTVAQFKQNFKNRTIAATKLYRSEVYLMAFSQELNIKDVYLFS